MDTKSKKPLDTVFVCAYNGAMVKTMGKKRRLTWWMIALGLVLLGAGYLTFRQIEMRLQKAEFKRAEAYVEQVAAKLKGSVRTNPDATNQSRSCSYAARKFAKGPRSCFISERLIYRYKTVEQANILLKEMLKVGGEKIYGYGPEDSTQYSALNSYQTITQSQKDPVLDSCDKSFTYYNEDLFGGEAFAGDFIVKVSCYGEALAEYYPIAT